MGKVKKRTTIKEIKDYSDMVVTYDPKLDGVEVIFTSNKLEEANKVIRNLELPKFDEDGNYIP
jgi:hypothetical protein